LVEQLREAIRQSGRTLTELGAASGVGKDRLSRFLRGERDLTGDAISKVCRALGLRLVSEGLPGDQEQGGD
jgi:transcriptional regulator with XRE-family HTH domain